MFILRRLIIKEWFRFFLGSCLVLFLLLTIGNLISGLLRGNVTPYEVLINYLLELPRSFNRIFPISCLVASLFSINKLKNRNELTAIFAAGFSRKNFLLAILQASLVVSCAQFIISAYIHPFSSKYRHLFIQNAESKFRNLKGQGLKASTIGSGKMWYKTSKYFFSFQAFEKKTQSLKNVTIYYFDNDHKLSKKVTASEIFFKDGKWKTTNASILENLNDSSFPNSLKQKELPIEINEHPKDFKELESDITTLNFNQLRRYIRKLEESGINTNEYKVIYYDKIASALICIIFALLSSIAMFNPNRRNSSFGKNIGFVFIFTIFYWLIYSYFHELGLSSKINPVSSAFVVPVLFTFFLFYFFMNNRKLAK